MFYIVNAFHVFCKKIELNPIICERVTNNKVQIFHKKSVFYSKSSKNVRFRYWIALKPAKTYSTHDFTLRKQYEDKTKNSKRSWIFQFLDVRVQWKFHVFKKSPRERYHLAFECTYSRKVIVFHVSCKSLS